MRKAKLLEAREVLIAEIDTADRMRRVSDTAVSALVGSITQLGVMKDEVQIRKIKHKGGQLKLMAGGHRIAAALEMGWTKIPAKIWDCSDDWAALMELDDNLASSDLSNLELASFLARRKALYEKLYPETKAGAAGGHAKHGSATDTMSFAESIAEKRELSPRHIRRLIRVGERLSPDQVTHLSNAPNPVKLADLMEIAGIESAELQTDVVKMLVAGEAKSAKAARVTLSPDQNRPPIDATDAAFAKLDALWARTPMAAKRRFLDHRSDELARLHS